MYTLYSLKRCEQSLTFILVTVLLVLFTFTVFSLRNQSCQVRGWLCKRGVKGITGRKWRQRWFSTDRDGRLYYYQKNNNTLPRGFIDLDVIIAVQDQPSSQQDINNACFNVVTPTRTYELMAHDEQEKFRWINALDYLRHWSEKTRVAQRKIKYEGGCTRATNGQVQAAISF